MRLSIVIPLYNKATTIQRCVESIFAQSFLDWELIVVDDGSTDGSADVLRALPECGRLTLITQQNGGVSAARNRGVAAATAEHVCFLDADDEWAPDHLSRLAEMISRDPTAVLFSAKSIRVDENGEMTLPRGRGEPNEPGLLDDFYDIYRRCSLIVNSSSACVHKASLIEIGGFPEGKATGEDIYVWFRLADVGRVWFSPAATVKVHLDAENRTVSRRISSLPYQVVYFLAEGRVADISASRRTQALTALLSSAMLNCAGAALRGDRRLAFAYLSPVARHSSRAALVILATALMPRSVLRYAQSVRRRGSAAEGATW